MGKINRETYLEELIEHYSNLVFSICFRITGEYFDAEDLTQDTFLSAYKNISSFDGINEKAWICKIATNKCLDYVKSAKRRMIPTEDDFFILTKSPRQTPEEEILELEVKHKLYAICSNLKPPYNDVAIDYFCNNMEIKEIAQKTGKNIKTLQTQIYRAKDMLRLLWRKEWTRYD